MNNMNKQTMQDDSQPCPNVFSSVEFGKFLSKEFPKELESGNSFLSKDFSLPVFDSNVFKSKDAFSSIFASSDWEMKFPKEAPKPLPVLPKKTMQGVVAADEKAALKSVLSSKEWMPMNTLGTHIDVSYSQDMFVGTNSEPTASAVTDADLPTLLPPAKTDWDNMFFSQLQLVPPPVTEVPESDPVPCEPPTQEDAVLPTVEEAESLEEQDEMVVQQAVDQPSSSSTQQAKKKRKRKPRKKVMPEVKVYVEPSDGDVLLGRGGRSNHHPGNKRYREEVKNLQSWYLGIEDKDEKTDLSQCLVDYVQSYDGRFLEKDSIGWYEVPNIVARRKASQALREDNDPEKRAAKRSRFLKKRAAMEKLQAQQAAEGAR